ncbi:MAG: hypothetical protein QOG09_1140 [Solirubrobacterales bacterium]|nr:hypothetical protein [Solirubrobacterales bacterium]
MATKQVNQDRILPATRWASLVVFLILVPAVVVLWGTPGHTTDRWSWTIKSDLTQIFLGAGYGAGAYFFWRTFRAQRWHPSSAGVLGAAAFAGLMLVATLLGWDKFNHGDGPFLADVAFYGWVGVYIAAPFVVAWLWLRNQRTDPRQPEPGDAAVPARVRTAARLAAAAAFIGAAAIFISPSTAIDAWPWTLTPLTARVIASFTAQVGVGALMLSFEPRWSGWRLLVQTFFVATALLLVGAIREWSEFDQGALCTWLYLGSLVAADIALLLLYRRMEHKPGGSSGEL